MTSWDQLEQLVTSQLSSLQDDVASILGEVQDIKISFASHIATDDAKEKRLTASEKDFKVADKRITTLEGNRKVMVAIISATTALVGGAMALLGGLING